MASGSKSKGPQNDLRRRTALTTGRLALADPQGAAVSAMDVLDELEESLNKRVDAEIETLAKGASALVGLAEIRGKDSYRVGYEGFEADSRVESMIKATENLLSLSHTLKLLFLLNDAADDAKMAKARDVSARLASEIAAAKAQAGEGIQTLLAAM